MTKQANSNDEDKKKLKTCTYEIKGTVIFTK
jgi:hypothetical protein